jgi:metal-responsive CopG/Arc/MetJ family transcriptional regulator
MRHTQVISVTIPVELAEHMNRLQKKKMKNYSSIVTEALSEYLHKEDYETQVAKMSSSAAKYGILSEEDIDRAIHEVKRGTHDKKNNR